MPVGAEGAEVKYVKLINADNEFGETYKIGVAATDKNFTLDKDSKKITLPDEVEGGRVFVQYER